MRTRRMPASGTARGHARARSIACIAIVALASVACQDETTLLAPGDVPVNLLVATFLPDSVFRLNPIELNGVAIEREWGGPLDEDLPYFQIRMSAEDGAGNPGEPIFVSAKAVYTETDIYFLFQWNDDSENVVRDALFLTTEVGPGCDEDLLDPANWSFINPFNPQAGRLDEDRFSVAFEMAPTGDARGTFASDGCAVACHFDASPSFGTPDFGRLDVWQWGATRTNPVRDVYSRGENGNSPLRGTPGYLDDQVIDPITGLSYDPGTPPWRFNFAGESAVPLLLYRPREDPFFEPSDPACANAFGEDCRTNNGLDLYYLWRDDLRSNVEPFGSCDTTNFALVGGGGGSRTWRFGDAVSGYWYTYPTGSRADIHGAAQLDPLAGAWTMEAGRALDTRDPANDVIFTGAPGDEVVFTVAVFDNSGTVHWGSGPQRLRFGPRDQRRPPAAQAGAGS